MLEQISQEIKNLLINFSEQDQIIFNNKLIRINKNNFQTINPNAPEKTIAFIDGGQAEIISTGNFCLSFIRVFGILFKNNKKIKNHQKEFYLFTKAKYENDDLFYESKIFGDQLIDEQDLLISSNHQTIKTGLERAPISRITNIARRFAELSLAQEIKADFLLLDGTLEPTFQNEDKYLARLGPQVSALAKTSSLFTTSGNSPVILLNQLSPPGCWSYLLENKTYFVKLHQKAKHVFRFEGNLEILPHLLPNSQDSLFLGYPYGLILADKFARISNTEKNSLKTRFLLNKNNQEILNYLTTTNAHDILDSIS